MFQAKLKSETLKCVVDVVSTLIDEAKFMIDANGVSLKAVDPAHVAMIDLHLDKAAFEQYSANDTELGLDLDKLRDVLRLSKAGDLIEMRQDEERNRLVISVGNITRRMNLVSTEGMSDPKVPNLTLPGKLSVNIEELQRGIKAAESISDHISLNASPDGFELISEGDTDLVSLKLPKDLLVSLDCKDSIRSLFPMDYFSNMIRAIPLGTVVSINLGNDLPVKLDFEIAGGKGKVKYLLAPRIEND
ncbi:MAG: proliferating cell nuclear antigen (pcna) [Methanomassiliicoccales archaeon]|nr:MAG: proliferating cell nuclear antigen (pcna) [Methanomassiliicoccales archaeon]